VTWRVVGPTHTSGGPADADAANQFNFGSRTLRGQRRSTPAAAGPDAGTAPRTRGDADNQLFETLNCTSITSGMVVSDFLYYPGRRDPGR